MEDIMAKYVVEAMGKLSVKIDEQFLLIIKPRPWWCPKWLYNKIIKESVEIKKQLK